MADKKKADKAKTIVLPAGPVARGCLACKFEPLCGKTYGCADQAPREK